MKYPPVPALSVQLREGKVDKFPDPYCAEHVEEASQLISNQANAIQVHRVAGID